ncbi:hypothetical protein MFFC18_00130 [Mariniblastus fucicola]|uniref:Uncharacterized protein n=1 Tax=Mariniblastus fucicola TaxID=980251 RepID=A0A5B9P695_9BACT|nr:hypothetical protein MFFC18_00130 [Mariniblastus fucicola]
MGGMMSFVTEVGDFRDLLSALNCMFRYLLMIPSPASVVIQNCPELGRVPFLVGFSPAVFR